MVLLARLSVRCRFVVTSRGARLGQGGQQVLARLGAGDRGAAVEQAERHSSDAVPVRLLLVGPDRVAVRITAQDLTDLAGIETGIVARSVRAR